MKQIVQSVRSGELSIVDVPVPTPDATEVLVATEASLVSAGTERAVRRLASASLLGKARARPELVRQVITKARNEGLATTVRSVRARLEDEMPLGYSAAGRVVEVGAAVSGVRVGDLVATGGAGHGEFQVVSGHLAVTAPEGVDAGAAAFATVGAIALHGLRQADVGPGGKVCVIGLGLVGQLTVRLALAAGLDVVGIDLRPWTADLVSAAGGVGLVEEGDATTRAVMEWSRGRGADAVIVTAATASSEPVRRSPALARDRASIVVVGDVGLELDRTPFYERELRLLFARSYGPGRYERAYEDWAVDLPAGHVRWTEGRNLEAFLDLLASERLQVADLVTHRFSLDAAVDAYELLESGAEPYLGIQLTYGTEPDRAQTVTVTGAATTSPGRRLGLLGAGTYASATLLPALDAAGFDAPTWIASSSGRSARHLAMRCGARRATSDVAAVLDADDVDAVVVATSHDSHAELAVRALVAGRAVFCEKPLGLSDDEVDRVEEAWRGSGQALMVGFNRRHAPSVETATRMLGAAGGPLVISYRVNAGTLPAAHWYHDRRQGGRLLGEVCHFVDTCNALTRQVPDLVWCTGAAGAEAVLAEDLVVALRYPDGSTAAITYASAGHPSAPKERIEVLGRGHAIVVDDFREVVVDGRVTRSREVDKGHVAQFRRLADVLDGRGEAGTEASLASMRVTLAAAHSLLSGAPVAIGQDGRELLGEDRRQR